MNTRNRTTSFVLGAALAITLSDVFVPIPVECPPSIAGSNRLPDLVLELTLQRVTP